MKNLYIKLIDIISSIIFPKPKIIGEDKLNTEEPAIYVCNHATALGPAYTTKYLKVNHRPWIIGYALDKEKAPNYIFHDFLHAKGKKCKWFYKILSHIIAFLLVPILKSYRGIPVYHDQRMMSTYRESLKSLESNENLVIFPESPKKYSKYVFEFQNGFVDVARLYYKNTGKELKFVPIYIYPKTMIIGDALQYDHTKDFKEQRKELAHNLTVTVDELAKSVPNHKNLPFLTQDWFDKYGEYVDNMSNYWKQFE
ncbi:MAG: 1-acyl-sn-glycerol-3-phosphate acyltransferase [Clostridia bacterium]